MSDNNSGSSVSDYDHMSVAVAAPRMSLFVFDMHTESNWSILSIVE